MWNAPYLDCDLHITNGAAIAAVEHEDFKEISASYMYDAKPESGEFEGEHYDIVMRNIRGNHVALVPKGRAGKDVAVADAVPAERFVPRSFAAWYRKHPLALKDAPTVAWEKLKIAMDDAVEKAARRIAWYNRFVEDARRGKKEIKGFFRANGANVPIREGETKRDALSILNAKHSSKQEGKAETSQPEKVRGVNELSPRGANTFTVRGFRNKQKLNNHWRNGRTHRDEYPEFKTAEEYEAAALKLPGSPCGGDITGHLDKEGNVIRYNKATNDFVKGHPDRGIKTMFRPIEGAVYYENRKEEDLIHGGKD